MVYNGYNGIVCPICGRPAKKNGFREKDKNKRKEYRTKVQRYYCTKCKLPVSYNRKKPMSAEESSKVFEKFKVLGYKVKTTADRLGMTRHMVKKAIKEVTGLEYREYMRSLLVKHIK